MKAKVDSTLAHNMPEGMVNAEQATIGRPFLGLHAKFVQRW